VSIYVQMLWGSANDGIGPGDERVQHVTPNLRILAASPRRHMKRMIGILEELQCRTLAERFAQRLSIVLASGFMVSGSLPPP
jgi:hypothetical protein